MKMNVKGLVFVGFAATVFAGAAQADGDKIVTSKTYVDNKITQTIGTSTTTAPSENAVKEALALKANDSVVVKGIKENGASENLTMTNGIVELPAAQTVGTGVLTIQKNGTDVDSFNANATANKSINIAVPTTVAELTDASNYQLTANISNAIATDAASETKYPSVKAMKEYVDGASSATNFVEDGITDAVTNKAPSENAVHDALALKQDADVAVKVGTAGTAVGSAQKTVYVDSTGTVQEGTTLGAAAEKGVATTVTENGTDLPTAGAVNTAITTAISNAATSYQDASVAAEKQFVANGDGGWEALDVDTTVTASSSKPVTSGAVATALGDYQTTANMSSNMATDTGSTSKYPTVAAVETYVTGLNNNLNLPANNTAEGTACDTNNPCALVWSGTGQPEWKRIAQQ